MAHRGLNLKATYIVPEGFLKSAELLATLLAQSSRAVTSATPSDADLKAAGWTTTRELARLFRMVHTGNASSKAADMAKEGFLERLRIHRPTSIGGGHAYVYRPAPPSKTFAEAVIAYRSNGADPVPKGYCRIIDAVEKWGVSYSVIASRIYRANLKPLILRTARTTNGLRNNRFFKATDLARLARRNK